MPFRDVEALSSCARYTNHTLRNSLNSKLFPALKYLRYDETQDGGDTLSLTQGSNNRRP